MHVKLNGSDILPLLVDHLKIKVERESRSVERRGQEYLSIFLKVSLIWDEDFNETVITSQEVEL